MQSHFHKLVHPVLVEGLLGALFVVDTAYEVVDLTRAGIK